MPTRIPLPLRPLPLRPLLLALALAALAWPLAGSGVLAHHAPGHGGGPGGGGEDPPAPVDGGWIYSHGDTDSGRAIFRTDPADGSTNPVAGAPANYGCDLPECLPNSGSIGVPSFDTHDGDRWYVSWRWTSPDIIFPGVMGPYHQQALEIDAVREGSTTGVRLTDLQDSCIYAAGFWPRWTNDGNGGGPDTAVSWLGAQWADLDGDPLGDCETFVQAGIFRADLQFDANGAVTGASAPVLEVEVPIDANYNLGDQQIGGWTWSPDGSQAAYTEGESVWRANVGDPVASRSALASGINAGNVDWSPDQDAGTAGLQTTIIFNGRKTAGKRETGLWTVAPDGSGLTLLVKGRDAKNNKQTSLWLHTPYWSPSGSHFAYTETENSGLNQNVETIRRAAADGSGNTALAGDGPDQNLRRLLDWTNVD